MRKVKIKSLPNAKDGAEVNTRMWNGTQMNWPAKINEFSEPGVEVRKTLDGVPREEATLEAEKGETIVMNQGGIPTQFKIGGKSHAQGGTPLNAPDGSFVFSKTKSMKIKDEDILKDFGISKGSATPAEIAKKYDINNFRKTLADPDSSDLDRKTAELMISNYNLKLAKLGLVQESMKGFPQGIPAIAMPYVDMMNINPADFAATQGQPTNPSPDMAKFGGPKLPIHQNVGVVTTKSSDPDLSSAFEYLEKRHDEIERIKKERAAKAQASKEYKEKIDRYIEQIRKEKLEKQVEKSRQEDLNKKKNYILRLTQEMKDAEKGLGWVRDLDAQQRKIDEAIVDYQRTAKKYGMGIPTTTITVTGPQYKSKEQQGEKKPYKMSPEEMEYYKKVWDNKDNVPAKPFTPSGTSTTQPAQSSQEKPKKQVEVKTVKVDASVFDTFQLGGFQVMQEAGTVAGGIKSKKVGDITYYKDDRGNKWATDASGKVVYGNKPAGTVEGYENADFEEIKKYISPEQAASLDMLKPGRLQHKSGTGYGKALPVETFSKNVAKWMADFEKRTGRKFDYKKDTGTFQKEWGDHSYKVAYEDAIAKGYPEATARKMAQAWQNSMKFDPAVKKGTGDPRGIDELYGEHTSRMFEPNWKPYEGPKTPGEEPKTEVAKKEEEKIPPVAQNLNAPWWLQDIVKTAGAAGDFFRVKKYAPWQATPGVHLPEATFYDPTRELAANAEAANIATQGLGAFTGPQSFAASAMGIQGQTAKNAADILGRYNNLNVGVANDFEIRRTGILNDAAANRANLATGLWDKYTIMNQQFDNAKNMARQNLRQSYIDAVTNKQYTANLNDLYEQYQIDPSSGGRIRWTHGRPIRPEDTSANDFAAQFKKYREILPKDVSNEDIFKVIMNQGKGTVPQGYDVTGSLYPGARTT